MEGDFLKAEVIEWYSDAACSELRVLDASVVLKTVSSTLLLPASRQRNRVRVPLR